MLITNHWSVEVGRGDKVFNKRYMSVVTGIKGSRVTRVAQQSQAAAETTAAAAAATEAGIHWPLSFVPLETRDKNAFSPLLLFMSLQDRLTDTLFRSFVPFSPFLLTLLFYSLLASLPSITTCNGYSLTTYTHNTFIGHATKKIASLEQQVSALNQSQLCNDDRYSRVKQENSTLLSKVHLLEEQLRDIEIQSEERRKEEEKRNRESMARLEREKSFETEKYVNRIFSLQQELYDAKESARKYQLSVEKMKEEKEQLQDVINNKEEDMERLQDELIRLREAVRRSREEEMGRQRICNVLQAELNDLKQVRNHQVMACTKEDHSLSESKLSELELTLTSLRIDNNNLREANEELQAQLLNSRLEEGRCLVRNGERVTTSLADELVTLNEEQVSHIQSIP